MDPYIGKDKILWTDAITRVELLAPAEVASALESILDRKIVLPFGISSMKLKSAYKHRENQQVLSVKLD